MKRTALLALLLGCGEAVTEPAAIDVTVDAVAPQDGATLYGLYCALCHGPAGEGYTADAANALANPELLATATDDFLRHAIARGRPGTSMSAWAAERGGPLDGAAIDRLVAHVRGWQTAPSVDVSGVTVTGVAERAETQYELRCKDCHGERGEGGLWPGVANPELLASASDGFLRHAIANGRTGTPMPAYGAKLTPQAIDDLVVLIRSWQEPASDAPFEAPVLDPATIVLNPGGPEPAFPASGEFVPADTVKAELDKGAEMVILDARPQSDYVAGHIAGAISVPFFAVEASLDQLPKAPWFVTYCACPHAESGQAAKALKDHGWARVRVLDEGYMVWKERGYPTKTGATP